MPKSLLRKYGTIREIRDGIALIEGLPSILAEEFLYLGNEQKIGGIALGFDEEMVKAIVFGDYTRLKRGDDVWPSGRLAMVPAGDVFRGRVINPLGEPLDGNGAIAGAVTPVPLEREAYGIIEREPVTEPLLTGIKAIDALIPVGRGQRELIIGDPKTGKTSLAIDAIINQKPRIGAPQKAVRCIYCSIGQKKAEVMRVFDTLRRHDAMRHTIGVAAAASDPAPLRYIAPYAAMAMAEYFRDGGEDVLVVFDDLTKHAWSWRELSNLLERIPGREGFPGDVFYLHSRLLERAGRRRKDLGGGSITAFPIVETQEGEIAGYIPTNVISITDGQIYLEPELVRAGIRPAIHVGLSVSRVGGKAQPVVLRAVSKGLRLRLAQYQELARFAGLEEKLEKETVRILEEGKALTEILTQGEREPLPLEAQLLLLLGTLENVFGKLRQRPLARWGKEFVGFIEAQHGELAEKLWKADELSDALKEELRVVIKEFTG